MRRIREWLVDEQFSSLRGFAKALAWNVLPFHWAKAAELLVILYEPTYIRTCMHHNHLHACVSLYHCMYVLMMWVCNNSMLSNLFLYDWPVRMAACVKCTVLTGCNSPANVGEPIQLALIQRVLTVWRLVLLKWRHPMASCFNLRHSLCE